MPAKGPARAKDLMELATSYQRSMVVLAANHLGIFAALAQGPLNAEAVAQRCECHPRSTAMLLNACVGLGLLSKEGEYFSNSPLAQRFLVPEEDSYLGDRLGLVKRGYEQWGYLADAVKENRRASSSSKSGRESDWDRNSTLAMHQGARSRAREAASILDLKGRRRLLDVGGGPGTYVVELVRRNPGLEATIFDLPQVLETTQELIAASGLRDRIHLQPGDYYRDSFGQDNDVVLFFGILHRESLDNRRMLLRKAWESLAPGGLVATRQFLLDGDRAGPLEATLFSLQMLLSTDSGEAYTWREIESLLLGCGFVEPSRKLLSTRQPYWLVLARKA